MFSIMEYVTAHRRAPLERAHRPPRRAPDAPRFAGRSIMLIDEAWHLVRRAETGEYANDLALRARHLGLVLDRASSSSSPRPTPSTAWRCCRTRPCSCCSPSTRASWTSCSARCSSPTRNASSSAACETVKGSHAQMLWINGTRGRGRVAAARRPDRVLGLHLRPGPRRPAPRSRAARARRRRLGRDQRARPHRRSRAQRERRMTATGTAPRRPPHAAATRRRATRRDARRRPARGRAARPRRCWRSAASAAAPARARSAT